MQDWSRAEWGLTLGEYALIRERSQAVSLSEYRRIMSGENADASAVATAISSDGTTKVRLPVLREGSVHESECVILPMESHRGSRWHTLCVSSQVGCARACAFCRTGAMGLESQLSAAEIVAQRVVAGRVLASRDGGTIRNIVFMGMGEPLDNLDAVLQSLRVIFDQAGLNHGPSQVTVSTVGRVEGLRRLAETGWRSLRLAISLGAARQDLRDELMPGCRGDSLADLRAALTTHPLASRGRFLVEYVLLEGVNDAPADADALAAWCRDLPVTVNLIPFNEVSGAPFRASSDAVTLGFLRRLRECGVFAKRRTRRGFDLHGACGQLGRIDGGNTPVQQVETCYHRGTAR